MDMKRFFLYFITIAALTLAGCGGGGGGTSLMVGGERATQDAIDSLEARPATDLTLAEITALMGRPATELTLAEIMALMGRPDTDLTVAEITALTGRPDTDLTVAEITALMGRPATELTLTEIMALMGRPATELTLAEITALMGRPDNITPTGVQGLRDQITAFETAEAAYTKAKKAGVDSDAAVVTAREKSVMITTLAVAGNSERAEENALAVLVAQTTAREAVTDAKNALMDAEAALADNADPMDSLTRALNAAIDLANKVVLSATDE